MGLGLGQGQVVCLGEGMGSGDQEKDWPPASPYNDKFNMDNAQFIMKRI